MMMCCVHGGSNKAILGGCNIKTTEMVTMVMHVQYYGRMREDPLVVKGLNTD